MKTRRDRLAKTIRRLRKAQRKYDDHTSDTECISAANFNRIEGLHWWFDAVIHDRLEWPRTRYDRRQEELIDDLEEAVGRIRSVLPRRLDPDQRQELVALHNWFHEEGLFAAYCPETGEDHIEVDEEDGDECEGAFGPFYKELGWQSRYTGPPN